MYWLALPVVLLTVVLSGFLLNLRRTFKAVSLSRRREILNTLGGCSTDSGTARKRFVGFFHPYCNAGGGGERVLWTAIAFLQRTEPDVINVVYSGDRATKEEIISKVKARFDIVLEPASLYFVFLKSRHLVEDATWPRFTLLGQSLGSIYLAWEAMSKFIPDLYIDTMGYAFTFYVVRLLGDIPVGAYIHYPTISTEMLHRVQSRKEWHTNSDTISSSIILSRGKQLYYRIFMYYYSRSLRNASFIMTNSTWTKNHVDAALEYELLASGLLYGPKNPPPVPPALCIRLAIPSDCQRFRFPDVIGLSSALHSFEKEHTAQLRAIIELFKAHPEYRSGENRIKLILMGSSRNADDDMRVETLKNLAAELGIQANVEFVVNASYPALLHNLSHASIGISTMVDEHFGINIVEFMAAGLIPVVHASGGPLNDIVVPRDGEPTGYHCTTATTFATALHAALSLPPREDLAMRERARKHAVERFSEKQFEAAWEVGGWKEKAGLLKRE